jgi:hypothetical protein
MSESATIIKPFFSILCAKPLGADTLQATEAEDKPLLGSKLSADFGAKTRLGFGETLSPSGQNHWDWHQSVKSQGPGDRVPREDSLLRYQLISPIPLFRRFRTFVGHMSPPSTSA